MPYISLHFNQSYCAWGNKCEFWRSSAFHSGAFITSRYELIGSRLSLIFACKCRSYFQVSQHRFDLAAHVRTELSQMHSHAPIILLTPDQLIPSKRIMTCNQMRTLAPPTHKHTHTLSLFTLLFYLYRSDLVYIRGIQYSLDIDLNNVANCLKGLWSMCLTLFKKDWYHYESHLLIYLQCRSVLGV